MAPKSTFEAWISQMTCSETAEPFTPTPGSSNPFRRSEEAKTGSGHTRLPQCSVLRPTIGQSKENEVGTSAGRKNSDMFAVNDTIAPTSTHISEARRRNTSRTQKGDSMNPLREYAQLLSSRSPQPSDPKTTTCVKPSELWKGHANHSFLPDRKYTSTIHPLDEGTTQLRPRQVSRMSREHMGNTMASPVGLNPPDPAQTKLHSAVEPEDMSLPDSSSSMPIAVQAVKETRKRYSLMESKSHTRPWSTPRPQGRDELNILILGETGVGKSTFINAFSNYLQFDSLDHALREKKVECIIPSTFTWHSLDGDEYVSRQIAVAPNSGSLEVSEPCEHASDGSKGQSTTQDTKTYEMNTGSKIVRLLDTPGIGDTRGIEQDKKNMDNILVKLRSVGTLHGILILLKPNSSRLTVMFNFCIKELLTHLHQNAAKNIVFGFTNSRNTSFRPGDTFDLLQTLLRSPAYQTAGIKLTRHSTYCFDSESFRCLAANRFGIDVNDMGDIENYAASWNQSSSEIKRMLERFSSGAIPPHKVSQTWDLHQTRELVRALTIPMTEITQTINKNISLQEQQRQDLKDALKKGISLKLRLHLDKFEYQMQPLEQPRTVCSHYKCTEYRDDKKYYKSICHADCRVKSVQVDKIRCDELSRCRAFGHGRYENCQSCSHSWQVHLHIKWEPVEVLTKIVDEAVRQRSQDNASSVEMMIQAIRSREELIQNYKSERLKIQKAAGHFAVFLKRSAITTYNDSTLEYLDHLIDEEKAKAQAGGSTERLEGLRADRQRHEEEVRTLERYAKTDRGRKTFDEVTTKSVIEGLFALKLSGSNLRDSASKLHGMSESSRLSQVNENNDNQANVQALSFATTRPLRSERHDLPQPVRPGTSALREDGTLSTSFSRTARVGPTFRQMLTDQAARGKVGSPRHSYKPEHSMTRDFDS